MSYKYSDFYLSFKKQIWQHLTFIAVLQPLAGYENWLSPQHFKPLTLSQAPLIQLGFFT